MKKYISGMLIILAFSFILMACSDDNNNENNDANNEGNVENNENIDDNNDNANNNNESNDFENDNNEEDNITDNNSDSDEAYEPEAEDQEGLKIGDTGDVDTSLGSFELTLDKAELVGPELDGEETFDDDLILLDITIKNTGDEALDLEDVVSNMMVSEDKEGGSFDGAEDFESVEKFTGTLEPGDEESGEFITDVVESEEYYFLQDYGSVAAGGSNQVIWKFDAEEAE